METLENNVKDCLQPSKTMSRTKKQIFVMLHFNLLMLNN
jgi:hypothetical protein